MEIEVIEVTDELLEAVTKSSDYDSLVATYIACRDGKEQLKREITERTKPIDNLMKLIEGKLLKQIETSKLESVKTAHGTVYKLPKSQAKVADWRVLLDYIIANEAYDLLKKDVAKDAVKARMDESNEPVPGVDMYSYITVGIRKA